MLKASAIVLLGLAIASLLRRRSAALRHGVLAAAAACAGAAPALELVAPAWHLPGRLTSFGRAAEPVALFIPISEMPRADHDATAAPRAADALRLARAGWLESIWFAGIGIGLAGLAVGFARLAWLASRSRRVSDRTWIALADTLSRRLGLGRPVALLQSDHPTLLVTWGLRRPRVILPRAARSWSPDRIRIVLGHEL